MEQQHQFGSLNIWDLLITPIYLFVILALATRYRDRKYPKDHPYHKLYMQGLYLKMAGAIFIGLIYSFYYAGGDTFAYHFHATVINSADSIPTWFKLMWRVSPDSDPKLYEYTTQMLWYREAATFTVARIAAVFGLFNGTHYLPTAILFAYFSFTGVWAMYTTFSRLYPNIAKKLAVAFLFIPSVVVWGSSIFKDTICLFSLGWMTYSLFRMFIQRDFSLKNVGILALCIYLLAVIKIYILIAIMPALMLWLLLTYSKKIRSVGMRWAINLGSVAALSAVFLFSMTYFSAQLDEYSLDKIIAKSQKTQSYLQYMSALQEGSGYNLGDYAPTPAGMLSKLPAAVNVTLFRPYLWESRKVIQILSALEATLFMLATLYVIRKRGIKNFFGALVSDPNLLFFIVFTLIFAFAVGISTGNFGSLSRYKIPCLPFYAAMLIIMNNRAEKQIFVEQEKVV